MVSGTKNKREGGKKVWARWGHKPCVGFRRWGLPALTLRITLGVYLRRLPICELMEGIFLVVSLKGDRGSFLASPFWSGRVGGKPELIEPGCGR